MPPDLPEANSSRFDLGCAGLETKLGKLEILFNNVPTRAGYKNYESSAITHKPTRNTYTPPSFNFSPPPPNNVSGSDNGAFSTFDKDVRLLL